MTQAQRITLYAFMSSGIQRAQFSHPPIKWLLAQGYLRKVPPYSDTSKDGLVDVTDAGRAAYDEETAK